MKGSSPGFGTSALENKKILEYTERRTAPEAEEGT